MHVTFDLSEIEETMLQQARKLVGSNLRQSWRQPFSLALVMLSVWQCTVYTAILLSPVQSIVQSTVSSPAFTDNPIYKLAHSTLVSALCVPNNFEEGNLIAAIVLFTICSHDPLQGAGHTQRLLS